MKRTIISAAAFAAAISAASAADLPSAKAPVYVPPPPPLLWTGFYGGLNLGGGWMSNSYANNWSPYFDPGLPLGATFITPGFGPLTNGFILFPGANNYGGSNAGVVGGGQIGYNYQFGGSIVIGVEADIQGTSIRNNNNGNSFTAYPSPYAGIVPGSSGIIVPTFGNVGGGAAAVGWFGTVRGRVGWLITPTLLLYGTGGFAYGGVDDGSWNTTGTGWTAGGGVEWMFMPNWSAKVEYLYVDLYSNNGYGNGGWGGGWGGGYNNGAQLNVVRAGVNYHFNWAAPAPVVAKY